MKACWAQLGSIRGPAEQFQGVSWMIGLCLAQFYGPDLSLYKDIGPWEVGRGCGILYAVMH